MGFFKKVAEKVKRVVSLKNVIGVATGNYLGVAKDALRIATTEKPVKNQAVVQDTTFFEKPPELPKPMEDLLNVKGAEQTSKMVNLLAQKEEVQDASSQVSGFMSKVYLQALWLKYKTWFIIAGVSITAFLVYWFGFRDKNQSPKRRAKGRR